MKSVFSNSKLRIALFVLFAAVASITTGQVLAKYMADKTVGTFDLQIKNSNSEVFAVLTTDNSLEFHRELEDFIPAVGSIYNGKTVSAVYRDIETTAYTGTVDNALYTVSESGTFPGWHSQAANITSVNFYTDVKPISTSGWFSGFQNCTSFGNLQRLDTGEATTMASMFYNCKKLTDGDISKLKIDTAKATSVRNMFRACSGLKNTDGTAFNFTNSAVKADPNAEIKLTDLRGMFRGCSTSGGASGLIKMDLSNLYIASDNVYLALMFRNTETIQEITFSDRTISSFAKSTSLNSNKEYYGTANMFANCHDLKQIDISFIKCGDTSTLEMFSNCYELTTIYADRAFEYHGTFTDAQSMFAACGKLVGGNGTSVTQIMQDYPSTYLNAMYALLDGVDGQSGYFTVVPHDDHGTITLTDNGDGTHTGICSVFGEPVTEEHTFDDDGNCTCGAKKFTMSGGLENVQAKDFTLSENAQDDFADLREYIDSGSVVDENKIWQLDGADKGYAGKTAGEYYLIKFEDIDQGAGTGQLRIETQIDYSSDTQRYNNMVVAILVLAQDPVYVDIAPEQITGRTITASLTADELNRLSDCKPTKKAGLGLPFLLPMPPRAAAKNPLTEDIKCVKIMA